MRYKKPLILCLVLAVLLVTVVLTTQPLILKSLHARLKSTEHFLVSYQDSRIRYEEGAEENAEKVFLLLSGSEETVAKVLNSSFEEPIRIFVCATQDSFNEYVFLSKNARGAVYWGNVFLSPGAFDRGSLSNLLEHELTHYLFYTHLGRDHMRNIPLWFREGIAVFVDMNVGSSSFNSMTSREKSLVSSGSVDYWFYSANPTDAVTEAGIANAMLYKVGASAIQYLYDSDPAGFDDLIQLLLNGENFDDALGAATKYSLESLLESFKEALQSSDN